MLKLAPVGDQRSVGVAVAAAPGGDDMVVRDSGRLDESERDILNYWYST